MYIHSSNLCFDYFKELYVNNGSNEITRKNPIDMPIMLSGGMAGQIWPDDNVIPIDSELKAPLPESEDIKNNQTISVKYRDLSYDDDYIFKAKLLNNVIMPERTLKPSNYDQSMPYRPNLGFAQRPQFQRDFAPAQRFIRQSINNQQYQQQQPGGFIPQQRGGYFPQQRQQDQYNSYQHYSSQPSSFDSRSQQQQQQQYHSNYTSSSSQQNYRSQRPPYPQSQPYRRPPRPYDNYRPNFNGRGSWS